MSQPIKKNQFGNGAGKGDWERPVDRIAFRDNFGKIRGLGVVKGKVSKQKGGKTTYFY